jgi:hypothetical protein
VYACSFAGLGEVISLAGSGGFLVARQIPDHDRRDAMGPYPLFSCVRWEELGPDLERLAGTLLSATLVPDPLAAIPGEALERSFDVVRPLGEHFVVDLSRPPEQLVSRHHARAARHAAARLEVVRHHDPRAFLDEWMALYVTLVARHEIRGIRIFSGEAFAAQLGLEGVRLFVARSRGRTVGADWYLLDGDVAYAHLAAFSEEGYAMGASYALQWAALEQLSAEAVWLDLGGAPGGGTADGLAFFKRGFATHVAPAYLCGRILDAKAFRALAPDADLRTTYFPPYRRGDY